MVARCVVLNSLSHGAFNHLLSDVDAFIYCICITGLGRNEETGLLAELCT